MKKEGVVCSDSETTIGCHGRFWKMKTAETAPQVARPNAMQNLQAHTPVMFQYASDSSAGVIASYARRYTNNCAKPIRSPNNFMNVLDVAAEVHGRFGRLAEPGCHHARHCGKP